ncbi:ubiquitin-ubiquitin ligase HUL5 [Sugiyamaella lignohabitans]|uniref:HECT-type E3 ubiquitin transferase n=1 Tax=Sugiyamaella lignohabitans TaxID=796027 RepID=A0A167E2Z4_9ASCO|nr:ubiquitin-ubiquitin ligase HUL5 [Sugiyamaella lignohabitans]ANB13578.1 ubiquitin-ubiquitin ligase HUL5 [Sugiyamaella lignohabitans]
MMNFSGQYRKTRNINLGGRNTGTAGSRESLLRKAQLDRQRREQARKEEKAALHIQSYYRGKRDLWNQRILIASEWHEKYIENGGQPISNDYEFIKCLNEFQFALRYLIHQSNLLDYVISLHQIVASHEVLFKDLLTEENDSYQQFFERFEVAILNALLNGKDVPKIGPAHLESLNIILAVNKYVNLSRPERVVPLLSQMAQGVLRELSGNRSAIEEYGVVLTEILKPFWTSVPQLLIVDVFSIPNIFSLISQSSFKSDGSISELTSPMFMNLSAQINSLDSNRKLWLLANSLSSFISVDSSLTLGDVGVITALLQYLDVKIIERTDIAYSESETSDHETVRSVEDSPQKKMTFAFSSSSMPLHVKAINYLYEREFTNSIFQLLSKNLSASAINLIATLYVYLIKLFPRRRKDLMLYLSLVTLSNGETSSSAVHVFWESFKQSNCYEEISNNVLSQTRLVELSGDFSSWTKLILTFELYSYWLIIADDTEFWENEQQGISFNEVRSMSIFLKNLCYSLIWNWPKVESESRVSDETRAIVTKLKDMSLLVIRQIYTRDSRRQFLGKDFWLMGNNVIDMEQFIPAVVEEEERQQEAALRAVDDSEDESDIPTARGILKSSIAPRLEILKQVPFFMPFDLRVHVFQAFIELDRVRTQQTTPLSMDLFGNMPRIKADIRRENLFEDAYRNFASAGPSFKFPIGVTFLSQGMPESGIDGGGLTKEFLTSVCQEGFYENDLDLFHSTKDHLLYPNPVFGVSRKFSNLSDEELEYSLSRIEFLGQIVGKCLYSEILVDVEFAPFFLLKWAGKVARNSFDDLYSLDPELYENLVKVHKYPGNVEEDLNLNFVTVQETGHGAHRSIELRPNGEDTPVTNSNRLEYIHSIANYKLNSVLALQTNRFLRGMSKVISLNWLSMFNAKELQMLISGGNSKIDLTDLKTNTVYGGYLDHDPTVEYFWQVVEELDDSDKRDFIKFVTSVPKAPLLGFSQLNPKFAIRNAGSDRERLPTSSTCVNLLKLPDYKNKQLLKEKLIYAIRSGAGFDLS